MVEKSSLSREIIFREARSDDVPSILRLLMDDPLGMQREPDKAAGMERYHAAFTAIDQDSNQELVVTEYNHQVIGTFQLTFIPNLTYQGGLRAQIESVRVDENFRNLGIGTEMMEWAIKRARQKGCVLIQLSSHKSRTDAHRFYEKLGFEASHVGMKFYL